MIEMEAGPYCSAIYEIADLERHPVGEAVNFAKLPIDFGVIHYASDTPFTQARTLGARGLSYFGMDSTYAASLAILRRVFSKELFQKNMALKKLNKDFQIDMHVLLPHQTYWNFDEAFEFVQTHILSQIP